MADKEIIIDGIDVSGCENLTQGTIPFGCMEDIKICSCMNNPNCLYKQFKRKEQELQAQRNFTTQEQRKIYCVAYDKTCETGNECKQKKCVFKDRLKYKQALDEIEKIIKQTCSRRCTNDCLGTRKHCGYGQIFNIINKIKEQETILNKTLDK